LLYFSSRRRIPVKAGAVPKPESYQRGLPVMVCLEIGFG